MTDQNDDSREQGVEFGPLADELEDEEYPMDLETLLERYGDHELGLGDDTATLQTVLESQGRCHLRVRPRRTPEHHRDGQ